MKVLNHITPRFRIRRNRTTAFIPTAKMARFTSTIGTDGESYLDVMARLLNLAEGRLLIAYLELCATGFPITHGEWSAWITRLRRAGLLVRMTDEPTLSVLSSQTEHVSTPTSLPDLPAERPATPNPLPPTVEDPPEIPAAPQPVTRSLRPRRQQQTHTTDGHPPAVRTRRKYVKYDRLIVQAEVEGRIGGKHECLTCGMHHHTQEEADRCCRIAE